MAELMMDLVTENNDNKNFSNWLKFAASDPSSKYAEVSVMVLVHCTFLHNVLSACEVVHQ